MSKRAQSRRLFALALAAATSAYGQGGLPGWRFWDSTDGMAEAYTTRVISAPGGMAWLKHGNVEMNLLNGYGFVATTDPRAVGPMNGAPDGTLWAWSGKALLRFRKGKWNSFVIPELTEAGSFRPVGAQEWEFHPVESRSIMQQGTPTRVGIAAISAERALILIADRVLEFDASRQHVNVALLAEQTNLGRLIGIYEGRGGRIWITGQNGAGWLDRTNGATNGASWQWHGMASLQPGASNFRELFETERGDLVLTANNRRGTSSVFRVPAKAKEESDFSWERLYTSQNSNLRGWPGLDGTFWLQDENQILELAAGKAIPVDRVGALSGIVLSVRPESNGRFWVTTTQGTARYSPPLWRTPPELLRLDELVSTAVEDRLGRLWFTSSSALLCFDAGQWHIFALPKGQQTWDIFTESLAVLADGRIALRTVGSDLLMFDPAARKYEVVKHPEGRAIGIFIPYHGMLLAQTSPAGDPDSFRFETFDGSKFSVMVSGSAWGIGMLRTVVSTRSGELWLGGSSGFGVYRKGRFERIGASQGYTEPGCYLVYEAPDGTIYAGGRESLFVLGPHGWRLLRTGLDRVRSLTTGCDGTLWVASGTGVHRYKNGVWISNEMEDGLRSNVVYRVYEDHSGRIWAGTTRGLSRYYPDADTDPPLTYIADEQNSHETGPDGQIRVIFSGIDKWKMTGQDRLLFSWRVDDGMWTPFVPAHVATYHHLPGGKRRFEVRAMDRNGNIERHPAYFAFTVPLPWFHTPAFEVAAGLTLAVIVVLFAFAIMSYRHRGRLIEELHLKKRLEADRQVILEMIARQKPLSVIFHRIARSVAVNCPGARCGVIRVNEGALEVAAEPCLPDGFRQDLEKIRTDRGDFDDLWAELHRIAARHGLSGCHFAPVRSGSDELLGAIAVFLRQGVRRPIELPTIATMSGLASAAIDNARLYQKLAHQAAHDVLTGLPNRLLFESKLTEALHHVRQTGGILAVFFLDLDRFKQINDSLGHRVGDLLLKQVASRLTAAVPAEETLARIGGDEFTILLQRHVDHECIEDTANCILNALRLPFVVEGRELFISTSIGISQYPQDGEDSAALQKHADSAMYRAKFRGKNCFEFFSADMVISTASALAMEQVLRKALDDNGFVLHYQPQIGIDGELVGMEALLRLQHPDLGLIKPALFISIAEETGLIIPIGQWVLREACEQIKRWERQGVSVPKLAVNVSALQFARNTFAATVARALRETEASPDVLELELTESAVMNNLAESAGQLQKLRSLGVRIAIDDFGTGYSSLTYLHRLPIDVLKIDRSFIEGIDAPSSTLPLVQAILALARTLGLEVIAEGVETTRQYSILRSIDCRIFQGYLFARPKPADSIEELLHLNGLHQLETALGRPAALETAPVI